MAVAHPTRNGSPLGDVSVRDTFRPGVLTAPPDAPVREVAAMMAAHGVHAIAVLREDARDAAPVLVVSDLDVARAAVGQGLGLTAAEAGTEPAALVRPDESLAAAARAMVDRDIAHLLVVERGGRVPIGMLSSFDVAAVLGSRDPRLARMLRPGPARPLPSGRSLDRVRVGDAMHPGVIACRPEATIAEVAQTLADHRVHCVAVAGITGVEGDGEQLVWGLVDHMDVVGAAALGDSTVTAGELAATAPVIVREDDTMELAAALMVDHAAAHVVVVRRSGLPSGVVSTLDVAAICGLGGD